MSLEKSELRAAMAHEIGVRLDDVLEAAKAEVVRWEGAQQGLLQGLKAVEGLMAHIDRDVEDGKYELDIAKLVKLYIQRAAQAVSNLAQQSANQRISAVGKVAAHEMAVKLVKKAHEDELRKASGQREIAEGLIGVEHADGSVSGTVTDLDAVRSKITGARPGMSIKERRLAEEAALAVKPESEPEAIPKAGLKPKPKAAAAKKAAAPKQPKPSPKTKTAGNGAVPPEPEETEQETPSAPDA